MAYGNNNYTKSEKKFTSPYKKNITNERNVLSLSDDNGQGDRASWQVIFSGNKARITVWTNIKGDPKSGRMSCIMQPFQWYSFLSMIESVKDNPERGKENCCFLELKVPNSRDKGSLITTGMLYAGKDDNGVIWISLIQGDRPKIKFRFMDDMFFQFKHRSGEKLSEEQISNILVKAYLDAGKLLVATTAAVEYVDDSDRPSYGGQKAESYRNKQQNTSYEEDIF